MRCILILASGVALTTAALANDSTASSPAGGLVLQRTDAIDMLSEDLFVSAKEIRVRYVFKNQSATNVDTVVAFPMPDRDLSEEYGGDVGYPSNFRTTVAGNPVRATLQRKAVLKGKDYMTVLKELKIPIAPNSINNATAAMDRLPAAQKRRLLTLGLAGNEESGDSEKTMKHHLIPLWTVKDSYWWTQRFPAGRELVVDHRYVPGLGGSVDTILNSQYHNESDPERRAYIQHYCIDEDFLAGVRRLQRTNQALPNTWIDYILTTGANWRSPIGSFRLVVDKGKPENLVSFCESGVKKIGPTQYEVRRTNWRPTRDLHVLIVHPGAWEM